jgi:serralysin
MENSAQALQIWSGVTNITFIYTSDLSAVAATGVTKLLFVHASDTSTFGGKTVTYGVGTSESATSDIATGTANLRQVTEARIQIDTSGNYGNFGSAAYSDSFGYGVDTLVHEVGHLVGLGHTGPYNGTVNPATDQNNSTDVRNWSMMSYIDPNVTSARYYDSRSPTDVNYSATVQVTPTSTTSGTVAPFTPMGLDIFAAQRNAGAPTSSMFAGGQIFGFNSNVTYTATDGSQKKLSMFDFTINTIPVVTLYDSGTGNTLDLSGYTTTATVNLNDGTFSSAAGLTDNIFIEYGTRIDNAVGGAGNDVFTDNANANIINGGGGTNTVVFSAARSTYTLTNSAGTITVQAAGGITDTLTNIQSLQFSDQTVAASAIPVCFCAGTRIATPAGETQVQNLRIGDLVLTTDGKAERVRWIRRQSIACRFADPLTTLPIRIREGAIADGIPSRDLYVSPAHAVAIGGILIHAGALVNGTSITQPRTAPDVFIYYHIELNSHALILAEGLAAESFIDNVDREHFDNWAEHEALFGDVAEMVELDMPRAKSARQVPRSVRSMLAGRAARVDGIAA